MQLKFQYSQEKSLQMWIPILGPEMKSTGEVLGVDLELDKAIYKGFVASNTDIPLKVVYIFHLRM